VFGSGANHWTYQKHKRDWQERIRVALRQSTFRVCSHVLVEGQMCFPNRRVRDQGNYRYLIEKALGDVLKEAWLADDDWGSYEFGGLAYRYVKGESWTKLMLFATLEEAAA
jgi:hypothetical protein